MINREWLDTEGAAEYLGFSRQYMLRLRITGGGPKFARPAGGKLIRYKREWIDDWMETQSHAATCEYAEAR